MTLEQLQIFVAVAEREHVTVAARDLGLTQSAVSNAIAALENRHNVRLFDRVGRGVSLNEVGRVFLPEAKAVLARAKAAESALADMSSLRAGVLTIFASQTVAGYWLPKRLAEFHALYPGIKLDVSIGNTREAARAVLEGSAEFGFVEGSVADPALTQTAIGFDRLVVVVRRNHPWAGRVSMDPSELTTRPWVLREIGSGTRSSFEAALQHMGVDPNALTIAMTLPTNVAVLAAAEAGAGATALSESVVAAGLANGALSRVPLDFPKREFRVIRHKDRYRSRAGDAFLRGVMDAD